MTRHSRTFIAIAASALTSSADAVHPPLIEPSSAEPSGHSKAAKPAWTHLGGRVTRSSTAYGSVGDLSLPHWLVHKLPNGAEVDFDTQGGVVATGDVVLAVGKSVGVWRLIACDAPTGRVRWSAPIDAPVYLSWSTPTIDAVRCSALMGAGTEVVSRSLEDGELEWTCELDAAVVNASVLVTGDMPGADRAFITDFDASGEAGQLYCINLDAFSGSNPFEPGEIVWKTVIGGTSGNSVAYANRTVYVASSSGSYDPGTIRAIDADALSEPTPRWVFTNPEPDGFFGGVGVARRGTRNYIYAASYGFSGGLVAGNLVKVDAESGAMVWSIPCNRTASIPVVLPDGRVFVSGGIQGFGTIPSLQCFKDLGDSVIMLWDTALQTWCDKNGDCIPDPEEFVNVGGWTTQPLVTRSALGTWQMFVGELPLSGINGPYERLFRINLEYIPWECEFIEECVDGFGNSPAFAGGRLFTTGPAGLASY